MTIDLLLLVQARSTLQLMSAALTGETDDEERRTLSRLAGSLSNRISELLAERKVSGDAAKAARKASKKLYKWKIHAPFYGRKVTNDKG